MKLKGRNLHTMILIVDIYVYTYLVERMNEICVTLVGLANRKRNN